MIKQEKSRRQKGKDKEGNKVERVTNYKERGEKRVQ